jgi:hypothetical protein
VAWGMNRAESSKTTDGYPAPRKEGGLKETMVRPLVPVLASGANLIYKHNIQYAAREHEEGLSDGPRSLVPPGSKQQG